MRLHPYLLLAAMLFAPPLAAQAATSFALDYTVTLRPASGDALVAIHVGDGSLVPRMALTLKPGRQGQLKADGSLVVNGNAAVWEPPARGGTLTLVAKINHERRGDGYDAFMDKTWAVFRGDDLVPMVKARLRKGASSRATLRFRLPPGWSSVDTGWDHNPDGSFTVDNAERRFDRPTGWMIAGDLGQRRERFGSTDISVSAPKGDAVRRMDVLSFVGLLWPSIESAFGRLPPKVLLVRAGDPMWRGGLSGPNSLFLHADRPLVSENGTSTLVHELVHVLTRIRGKAPEDDWIAEGLAEFYSIELMQRAGGMTDARRAVVDAELKRWSAGVKTLRTKRSKGPVTARAALLFGELDAEIRKASDGRRGLDDVVRMLIRRRDVSLIGLRIAADKVAGGKLRTFDSPLLR